jgi:hypothetical protein
MTTLPGGNSEVFAIRTDMGYCVFSQKFNAADVSITNYTLTQLGAVKAVSVTKDGLGNPLLFVVGLDNRVYEQHFNANGDSTGAYAATSAEAVLGISACQWRDSAGFHLELFAVGLNGLVYGKNFDANGNALNPAFFLVSAAAVQSIEAVAVTNSPGGAFFPEVFALGLDNEVYGLRIYGNGGGGSFAPVQPGAKVLSFSAAADASGRPFLLVVGLNSLVYEHQFNSNGSSTGFAYTHVGPVASAVKSVCVDPDANGNYMDFAVGLDNQLYEQKLDPSGNLLSDFTGTRPGMCQ